MFAGFFLICGQRINTIPHIVVIKVLSIFLFLFLAFYPILSLARSQNLTSISSDIISRRKIFKLTPISIHFSDNEYIITKNEKRGRYLYINDINLHQVIYCLCHHLVRLNGIKRNILIKPYFYLRDCRSTEFPKTVVLTPDDLQKIFAKIYDKSIVYSQQELTTNIPKITGRFVLPLSDTFSAHDICAIVSNIADKESGYLCRYKINTTESGIDIILAFGPDDILPISSWSTYITRRVRIVVEITDSRQIFFRNTDLKKSSVLPIYGSGFAYSPTNRLVTLVILRSEHEAVMDLLREAFGLHPRVVQPDPTELFPWARYQPFDF